MTLRAPDHEEILPLWKARLTDPLSAPCREKRRLLLLSSTVTLIFVLVGLFPTKIDALGITFENKDRGQMVILMAAVNIYALVGFVLYAWSDFHLMKRRKMAATTGYVGEFANGRSTLLESVNYYVRFWFEFLIPAIYGIYALYRLYLVYTKGAY